MINDQLVLRNLYYLYLNVDSDRDDNTKQFDALLIVDLKALTFFFLKVSTRWLRSCKAEFFCLFELLRQ